MKEKRIPDVVVYVTGCMDSATMYSNGQCNNVQQCTGYNVQQCTGYNVQQCTADTISLLDIKKRYHEAAMRTNFTLYTTQMNAPTRHSLNGRLEFLRSLASQKTTVL